MSELGFLHVSKSLVPRWATLLYALREIFSLSTQDYWSVRWDLTRALKEKLEEAGCSLPYPQSDVYLHQPVISD